VAERLEPMRVDVITVLPWSDEYTSVSYTIVENVIASPVRVLPVNVDTPRLVVVMVDPVSVEKTVITLAARVLPVSVEKVILDAFNVLAINVDWTTKELTVILLPKKVDLFKLKKLMVHAFKVDTLIVSV
jgi:hypothetical protein